MAGAAENALLHNPRIRTNFQHVQIVIGLEHQAIRIAEMNFDKLGHVAQIGHQGYLYTISAKREAHGIGGIMRNSEGVDFDVADSEALTGVDGLNATEAFG